MAVECIVDGRPVADQAYLCSGCGHRLEGALRRIPELMDELEVTILRLSKTGEDNLGRRSASTPLAFDFDASTVKDVAINTVMTWARLVSEERGIDLAATSAGGCATWLLGHVEWLRHHPAGGEALDEICHVRWLVHATVDLRRTRAVFPVGPCPECEEGSIRAVIPADETRPAELVCDSCETKWATHQWLRIGRRILDLIRRRRAAA